MEENKTIQVFDWYRIFISDDLPITYFSEIAFRTFVMFSILIIGLKFLSKRGVKQLSVFELAILMVWDLQLVIPCSQSYPCHILLTPTQRQYFLRNWNRYLKYYAQ